MVTIDDFERSSVGYDSTPKGTVVISTTTAQSGTRSLEADTTQDTATYSYSSLPEYPSAGDEYRVWVRLQSGSETRIVYGVPDGTTQGYEAYLNAYSDQFELVYNTGGGRTSGATMSLDWTPLTGTWFEVAIEWGTDGSHNVTVYDPSDGSTFAQLSYTEATYSSGGIGFCFWAWPDAGDYVDNAYTVSSTATASAGATTATATPGAASTSTTATATASAGTTGAIATPATATSDTAPPQVAFDLAADWDASVAESGVVHENVTYTDNVDAGTVKKGYSVETPYRDTDLIMYYPLHDEDGTTVHGLGQSEHNATNNGATVGAQGLLGTTAYSFDGTDDYIDFGGVGASDGSYSISMWVYPNNWTNNQQLFFWGDEPPQFAFWKGSNGIVWTYWNGNSNLGLVGTPSLPPTGEWTHLVGTYDDSTGDWKVYFDGELMRTVNDPIDPNFSGTYNRIGRHPNGRFFDGRMWELRIYSGVLSQSEVQYLTDVVRSAGTLTTDAKRS